LTNVIAVSANGDADGEQSLVLKSDGTVAAWGNVSSVPNGLSDVVAIAAGGWHDLALKSDGTVVGWGDDTYGQTDIPVGMSNVVAIAAGDWHSVVLKADGTVAAWGVDWKGEVSGTAGLSNVVAIAAGAYRTVALRSDGTMFACGNITSPPASFTNVVAISTGSGHTVAVLAPLQITSITRTNQNSLLRFHTFSGQQYSVEYSPSLNPGSWTSLPGSGVSGDGRDALVTDTNATASINARFYRLKQ
jgi:alpha-tubulin suppressor-like RCC1 family protein